MPEPDWSGLESAAHPLREWIKKNGTKSMVATVRADRIAVSEEKASIVITTVMVDPATGEEL